MKHTNREVQSTFCAISTTSSLENKTGSWRFAKPVFIDRLAPCNQQCPAGEDIASIMYLAGQGRFEDAWKLIMQANPFPAIMGRVCYHNCETKCNRSNLDNSIAINIVERFIGDYALEHNLKILPQIPDQNQHVAIIGAGPAGLTAAYDLRLKGYQVTVFDANDQPGGLMRYGIPPYRLPNQIIEGEISRLYDIGVLFKQRTYIKDKSDWDRLEHDFNSIFISIGASRMVDPDLKGNSLKRIYHSLSFLKEINQGKRPDIGDKTIIIGGGNSAIDCARVSRRLGAKVTLIYRRTITEMPAYMEEIEMAQTEGVEFIFLAAPEEFLGTDRVKKIKVMKMKQGQPDESGRLQSIPTEETFEINCTSVIISIGETVNTEDLPSFLAFENNSLKTDSNGSTSHAQYFAGGDLIQQPHTVTHAIASGKRAGLAIDQYLSLSNNKHESSKTISFLHKKSPVNEVISYNQLNPFYFINKSRTNSHKISLNERINTFKEVFMSSSQKDVIEESQRCFVCGTCTECGNCYVFCPDFSIKKHPSGFGYHIDLDYCKGCGICVKECPRGAMQMEFAE